MMKKCLSLFFLIVALVYIFYNVDLSIIVQSIKGYSLIGTICLFLATIFNYYIIAVRWSRLSFKKVSTKPSFEASIICTGINNLTPARIGDLARIYYLSKLYKSPVHESVPITFLERFLDLISLSFIASFMILYVEDIKKYTFPVVLVIAICIIFLFVINRNFDIILKQLKSLKNEKISNFISNLLIAVQRYTLNILLKTFILSLCLWFYYIIVMYLFINTSTNMEVSFLQVTTIFVISALGISMPTTPASIGLYEASIVLAMGWFGINKEMALAFALTYHFIQILSSVIFTFIILYFKRIDFNILNLIQDNETEN